MAGEAPNPLTDVELGKAVSGILQRAERQENVERIVSTFVDVGVVPQLENRNNQIMYGRRGTGKTHVIRVIEHNIGKTGAVVCYLDTRILGSTSQFTDETRPLGERGMSLFKDLLGEVQNALLDHVVGTADERTAHKLDLLQKLGEVITRARTVRVAERYEEALQEATNTGHAVEFGLSNTGPSIRAGTHSENTENDSLTVTGTVRTEDSLVFAELQRVLRNVLTEIGTEVFILIDEWSSIPLVLQPLLAELLKHSLLPIPYVTLKIASLEYRSRFGYSVDRTFFGFELGSDISANLDLDDYYVYDRNPKIITAKSAEILLSHIAGETGREYLSNTHRIHDGDGFVSRLFTTDKVFDEMVRASEGVARDLINIFATSYFDAARQSHRRIQKTSILTAARQWFEKDKAQNLDDAMQNSLRRITDEVIGHRRARSFMVPREMEKHNTIQRLFDARVLHLVIRGYADKDNPGKKYNIYTLDYGTYVDLLNTSREPELGFIELKQVSNEFVVPFDDRRSIRRIVLDESLLNG